jgi:hypothetical protein
MSVRVVGTLAATGATGERRELAGERSGVPLGEASQSGSESDP